MKDDFDYFKTQLQKLEEGRQTFSIIKVFNFLKEVNMIIFGKNLRLNQQDFILKRIENN